jgi:pimeloyl-ACP methyl ester carboxylesterase
MKRSAFMPTTLAFLLCGCGAARPGADVRTAAPAAHPIERGHAAVNGIRIYYEVHGRAGDTPLVLLHGGGSSIDVTYGRVLPLFAQRRRVIALDEQNHGLSDHRSVPERFADSAEDVAALLQKLGVTRADLMGFSNGANVALEVAIRHPGLVRKLVFAASMTKRSGAAPQFWEMMSRSSFADMPQPLKDAFLKQVPDETKLRDMYEKDAERMRNFVEIGDDAVRSVRVPVLVIAGDRDVPTPEHALELSRLFPRAQLAILPGSHGEFLGEDAAGEPRSRYPEVSAWLIEAFLDGGGSAAAAAPTR